MLTAMIDKLGIMFMDEFARWIAEASEQRTEEEVIEKLCDGMDHLFRTPCDRIGEAIPKLDPGKIQEIIKTAALTNNYEWSGKCFRKTGRKEREWILRKEDRELTIVLMPGNYLILVGLDWSVSCFGLLGLTNAISLWAHAEGAML